MRDNYTVALYIRLSAEDENVGESNSVKNQRDLLRAYVKRNAELSGSTLLEFCDDGYSGVNFDRPGVSKMLDAVRKGKINCIIVKDFSRFGRNYIEVGDYLEQVFPFLDVRFISVNDNYDSSKDYGALGGIEVALRTLIYDLYSKDLSQKVKSAIATRHKKGEYISNYAIYGYRKSDEDNRKLVIDEEAAKVVRRIFEYAMSGKNAFEIARTLNDERVPTKSQYKRNRGCTRDWDTIIHNLDTAHWSDGAIRKIINDERYTGMVVSGIRTRFEVGNPNAKAVPKSEWVRVPEMHEPIVTPDEFALAVKRLPCQPKPRTVKKERVLYDKVRCGNCYLALRRYHNVKFPHYSCVTPRLVAAPKCVTEPVSEVVIEETLLSAIRIQAESVVDMQKAQTKKAAQTDERCLELQKAIRRHETTIKSITATKQEQYERFKDGLIDKEQYFTLRDDCNEQMESLTVKIEELKILISELSVMQSDMSRVTDKWLGSLRVEVLSRELVDALVESIIVYDSEHIEIKWKYADEFV